MGARRTGHSAEAARGAVPRGGWPRARAVRVEARAKLNLGLAVGPRRPDGYHEIATLFQSISLADTLTITPRRAGFSLDVRFEEVCVRGRPRRDRIPTGRGNLVLRAARLLSDESGIAGGAHFLLVKRIPAGAGLGGGSADAAAALVGLARLYGARLGRARRLGLGARLGADVPFCCLGGTALGLGRGEILKPVRLRRPFRAVVAIPAWRVSTAQAFSRIDRVKYGLTRWGAKLRFAQALERDGVTASRGLRLGNTFEMVLGDRRADFESLCARMKAAGLRLPHMTGSGSAVFGIVRPRKSAESVVGRVDGDERLHVVSSTRSGMRVAMIL